MLQDVNSVFNRRLGSPQGGCDLGQAFSSRRHLGEPLLIGGTPFRPLVA
jgi:hypothetical protein